MFKKLNEIGDECITHMMVLNNQDTNPAITSFF